MMIPVIDDPTILALYAPKEPQAVAVPSLAVAAAPAPQYARAPAGNGHEAALKQGGAR